MSGVYQFFFIIIILSYKNLVPPNTACTKATICSGGSHCINDICTCELPLVPINNTCSYPPSGMLPFFILLIFF